MERDNTLDAMKGVAIIAMVIGHLSDYGRGLIYSFHMPLFFILAGYVYKQRPIMVALFKDVKRLLLPYLLVGIFTALCLFVVRYDCSAKGLFSGITALIWGSGTTHSSPIFGDQYIIGAIWFLLAMFWCKTAFNILKNKTALIDSSLTGGGICLIISILAVLIDNYIINLPFGILAGLSAMTFYYVGYEIKNRDIFHRMNKFIAILCLAVWLVAVRYSNLEMANLSYYRPVLAVAGAICITLFLYWLLSKFKLNTLSYIGSVSMAVLCCHKIITSSYIRSYLELPFGWPQILFDVVFISLGIVILRRLNFLGNIFGVPGPSHQSNKILNRQIQ